MFEFKSKAAIYMSNFHLELPTTCFLSCDSKLKTRKETVDLLSPLHPTPRALIPEKTDLREKMNLKVSPFCR